MPALTQPYSHPNSYKSLCSVGMLTYCHLWKSTFLVVSHSRTFASFWSAVSFLRPYLPAKQTHEHTHTHQDLATPSRRLMSAKLVCFPRLSFPWWSQMWKTFWNKTLIGSLSYCLELRYRQHRTTVGGKKRGGWGVLWGIECTGCSIFSQMTLKWIMFPLDTSVCAADSPGPARSRVWCPCAGWRSIFTVPSGQVVCPGGKGQSSICNIAC